MPRITYSKVAYISVGDSRLDELSSQCCNWADVVGTFCMSREQLDENIQNQSGDLREFLVGIRDALEDGVGDLVFTN